MGSAFAIEGTIGYREGWMCLVSVSTDFNEPKRVRQWWRIEHVGPGERELIDLEGCFCSLYNGTFSYKMGLTPFAVWARPAPAPRDDDGKVRALATEVEPYPCPPVRKGIETRYRNGKWEKYLKTKGWVAA